MFENVKSLIVVLALGMPAFYIAQRIAVPFIRPRELVVWRNAWFAVTIAAFLLGNFFAFAVIVTMVCLYARFAHAATVGLFFVLLFAAPLVNVSIGGVGVINRLFEINNGRLLTIVLLLPILFTTSRPSNQNSGAYSMPDWLVVSYVLLSIGLEFRRSDLTNIMRVTTLQTLDVLVPYFAFSRAVTNIADFRKVSLAFVIAVLPLSLIALIEIAKGWHLYGAVAGGWGGFLNDIRRDGILRASASAGSGITLGYVIMVAIGCTLSFWQRTNPSRTFAGVALIILSAGLIATLSRGPWIGAVILVVIFIAMGPNAIANFGRLALISTFVLVPLLLTPVGGKIIAMLPFIGSVDASTVDYRQRLVPNALAVIERNPWIGSVDYLSTPELKTMVQGEGIIDLVNSYLAIALYSGIVGLSLFLTFFATVLIGLRQVLKFKFAAGQNINFSTYARASMATLLAILVTIGTTSSIDYIPYVYWSFAGLCVALIRIPRHQAAVVRAADAIRRQQIPIVRKSG